MYPVNVSEKSKEDLWDRGHLTGSYGMSSSERTDREHIISLTPPLKHVCILLAAVVFLSHCAMKNVDVKEILELHGKCSREKKKEIAIHDLHLLSYIIDDNNGRNFSDHSVVSKPYILHSNTSII